MLLFQIKKTSFDEEELDRKFPAKLTRDLPIRNTRYRLKSCAELAQSCSHPDHHFRGGQTTNSCVFASSLTTPDSF